LNYFKKTNVKGVIELLKPALKPCAGWDTCIAGVRGSGMAISDEFPFIDKMPNKKRKKVEKVLDFPALMCRRRNSLRHVDKKNLKVKCGGEP
jgi:hypothetical protein